MYSGHFFCNYTSPLNNQPVMNRIEVGISFAAEATKDPVNHVNHCWAQVSGSGKERLLARGAKLYAVPLVLLFMASRVLISILPICSLVPNKSLRLLFLSWMDCVRSAWN